MPSATSTDPEKRRPRVAPAAPQRRFKPEDRRLQLVEATIRSLARWGAHGTGVRRVCRELEVAPSLVNYFFAGWDDLLLNAYRLLAERFMAELRATADARSATAEERVRAVIGCSIGQQWQSDEIVGAYLALWELSRTEGELKKEFGRFHRDRKAIVRDALEALVRESGAKVEVDVLATSLLVFLDGLWLELGLKTGNIQPEQAVEMGWLWVEANLAAKPRTVRAPSRTRRRN